MAEAIAIDLAVLLGKGVVKTTIGCYYAPQEVNEATDELCLFERKVVELIELREKYKDFLFQKHPEELPYIHSAITHAWNNLHQVELLVEKNTTERGRASKISFSQIMRRVRWSATDKKDYQSRRDIILRNHDEVRDQLNKLRQLVVFDLLAKSISKEDEEKRKKKEEEDARQARLDVQGLEFLSLLVS